MNELRANGSTMELNDLARYQATVAPALTVPYGEHQLATTGKGSGGTTLGAVDGDARPA